MAYKVGQRVRIVKVVESSEDYEVMKNCIGKEGIVRNSIPFDNETLYDIRCDDDLVEQCFWQESELEPME